MDLSLNNEFLNVESSFEKPANSKTMELVELTIADFNVQNEAELPGCMCRPFFSSDPVAKNNSETGRVQRTGKESGNIAIIPCAVEVYKIRYVTTEHGITRVTKTRIFHPSPDNSQTDGKINQQMDRKGSSRMRLENFKNSLLDSVRKSHAAEDEGTFINGEDARQLNKCAVNYLNEGGKSENLEKRPMFSQALKPETSKSESRSRMRLMSLKGSLLHTSCKENASRNENIRNNTEVCHEQIDASGDLSRNLDGDLILSVDPKTKESQGKSTCRIRLSNFKEFLLCKPCKRNDPKIRINNTVVCSKQRNASDDFSPFEDHASKSFEEESMFSVDLKSEEESTPKSRFRMRLTKMKDFLLCKHCKRDVSRHRNITDNAFEVCTKQRNASAEFNRVENDKSESFDGLSMFTVDLKTREKPKPKSWFTVRLASSRKPFPNLTSKGNALEENATTRYFWRWQ